MAENVGHHPSSDNNKGHHFGSNLLSNPFPLHARVDSLMNKNPSHGQHHLLRADLRHELDIVNQSIGACIDMNSGGKQRLGSQIEHEHINEPVTSAGTPFQTGEPLSLLARAETLMNKAGGHGGQHILRGDLRQHELDMVNQSLGNCLDANSKHRISSQMDIDHVNESPASSGSSFPSVKSSSLLSRSEALMNKGQNGQSQHHRGELRHDLDMVNQNLGCLEGGGSGGNSKQRLSSQMEHEHISEPSTSGASSFQPVEPLSLLARGESLMSKTSHGQQHILRAELRHELDIVNQSLGGCLDTSSKQRMSSQMDLDHVNDSSAGSGASFQSKSSSLLARGESLMNKTQGGQAQHHRHDLDMVNQNLGCLEGNSGNSKQRLNSQIDHDHINEPSTSGGGGTAFQSVKPSPSLDMTDYFMYIGNSSKMNVENMYSNRNSDFGIEKEQVNKSVATDDDEGLYSSEVFKSNISTPSLQDDVPLDKIYKCELCSKIFSNSFFLRQHTLFHTGDKQFVCGTCGHKCFYKSQLKEHERTHTGEKPHKCHICETGFARKDALKRHLRSHMDEKPYKCDICEKEFKHKPYLQIHKKIHTGERPHKCEICEKMFSRIESLKRHRISHIKEKAYPCNYCDKSFKCLTYLHNHTQNHTGQKLYGCDLCEKKFKYPALLKKHKMKHTGERPFRCDLCEKGYFTATELKIHKMNHAATDPPFQCEFCGKGFHMNDLFQAHVRTHTGERLKCRYCDNTFTQQSSLHAHERMHMGDKPYMCPTCGLTYTQLSSYNAHVQTHVGEMPYKCEPCGRRYQHYASYRYHQNVCAFYNPPVPKQNNDPC